MNFDAIKLHTKFGEQANNLIFENMLSPKSIYDKAPINVIAKNTVDNSRNTLRNILERKDHRLIMVVGPCSIHDLVAGFDYAKRLKKLADEVSDEIHIVMRVYFEKPRTTVGWKGFINDPCLDGTSQINIGIEKARQFLLTINELGLSVGTEFLDPNSLWYLNDLVSWGAIGARTVESQVHRELASALNFPVGFKNSTNGSLDAAINGILAASKSHAFIGMNDHGNSAIVRTIGNQYGHIVLRGGLTPNYDKENVDFVEKKLELANLPKNIMIDCSHGNSSKDYKKQVDILANVIEQICNGNDPIIGIMLESNIEDGNQEITLNKSELRYGCSITDGCLGWETTERIILQAYNRLKTSLRINNDNGDNVI